MPTLERSRLLDIDDARYLVGGVVVLGDSVSTSYGIPAHDRGANWTVLLRRSLADVGGQVQSRARQARSLADDLGELEKLTATKPAVVIVAHGGWEGLLALPRWLQLIRSYPFGHAVPAGERHRFSTVRRALWTVLLKGLRRDWSARLLGARPHVAPEQFEADLESILNVLTARTSARILLLQPTHGRLSVTPWSDAAHEAHRATIRRAASSRPNVQTLDLAALLTSERHFAPDGAHLSGSGHSRVAAGVLDALF